MPTNIAIPARESGGAIPAYCASPEGDPRGAIVVIPEIFGVNHGIVAKCDAWAAEGYLAVAPDIFWRFAPRVELDPDVEEEFQQALDNMNTYVGMQHDGRNQSVEDAQAIADWLRAEQGIEKVGLVGFCLGGRIAYLCATRTSIDANVGYYGVMIDQALNEAHAIANPLLLHIPTADHFVGPEARKAIHDALGPNPHVTLHDYEGLDHGFAVTSGNRRDEEGARLADERTRAFFAAHIG